MARGFQSNQERLHQLAMLGKPLSRRAGSKCELCEQGGVPLKPYEIPPAPEVPDMEHTLLLCETCRGQIEKPKSIKPEHWRCLYNTVWSEHTPVRALALRVLFYLQEQADWASELLDQTVAAGDEAPDEAEELARSGKLGG